MELFVIFFISLLISLPVLMISSRKQREKQLEKKENYLKPRFDYKLEKALNCTPKNWFEYRIIYQRLFDLYDKGDFVSIDKMEQGLDDIILSDIICQDMIDSEHIILIKDNHAFIQDKCKINNRISKIVRNENEDPYLEVKPTEINGQYYIVTDTKVYRYLSEQEKTKKLYK